MYKRKKCNSVPKIYPALKTEIHEGARVVMKNFQGKQILTFKVEDFADLVKLQNITNTSSNACIYLF